MIKLTIPGKPMGKQRHRTTKSGHTFTPQKTVNYETRIQEAFRAEYPDHVPFTGRVWMSLDIYCPIPVSTSNRKRAQMLENDILPTKKPDIDNVIKLVADALNGIAYADDKQIVGLEANKWYSDAPRLRIGIITADCEEQ